MIRFKITPIGGYVIGDGPVPGNLDPDVFMKMFMHKVLDAQAQGKQELILNDEEIAEEIKQCSTKAKQLVTSINSVEFTPLPPTCCWV